MTSNPESQLFDFAGSKCTPETEDEQMVTDIHAALELNGVPLRLRKPPAAPPTRSWRHYFPAAAAVILVIALLGANFSILLPHNESNDQPALLPPLAPLPILINQPQESNQGCTFDRQPLIFDANSFPLDELSVIQTDAGELKLYCPGNTEEILLAQDVVTIEPTGVPETLLIGIRAPDRPEYEPARHALVSLRTGKVLNLVEPRSDQTLIQSRFSPWFISNHSKDSDDLILTDLRTMENHKLEAPDWLDDGLGTSAYVTSSEDGQATAVVLTVAVSYGEHRGQLIGSQEDTPQILIVRDQFETSEWIDTPSVDGPVTTATMSPDGQFIAIGMESNNNNGNLGDVTQYAVVDIRNGEEVGRTRDVGPFLVSSAQWSLDSSNFIYTIGDTLGVVDVVNEDSERVVLQADGGVDYLMLTQDPNVVLVDVHSITSDTVSSLHRVHLDTGESERLGKTGPRVFPDPPSMRTPVISVFESHQTTIINAATGEALDSWVFEEVRGTPTGSEEIVYVRTIKDIPFVAREHEDGMELWIWDYNLNLKHLIVPKLPSGISNYQLKLVGEGRYIVIQEYPEPIDPDNPLVTYILDTDATAPTWLPVD